MSRYTLVFYLLAEFFFISDSCVNFHLLCRDPLGAREVRLANLKSLLEAFSSDDSGGEGEHSGIRDLFEQRILSSTAGRPQHRHSLHSEY